MLQCGILRHYFNLLEVKLTRDAQLELLQLFDMVIQYDVIIIGKCHTLNQSTESTERWHLRFNVTIELQYRYINFQ